VLKEDFRDPAVVEAGEARDIALFEREGLAASACRVVAGRFVAVAPVPLADTNFVDQHALQCYWGAVSAVSDTNSPRPGVASTGLRLMWRHRSLGFRRVIALELANWKRSQPAVDFVRTPHALAAKHTRARECALAHPRPQGRITYVGDGEHFALRHEPHAQPRWRRPRSVNAGRRVGRGEGFVGEALLVRRDQVGRNYAGLALLGFSVSGLLCESKLRSR